ncbi:MAG: phosphopantothenoylcysteine decarboxylase [Planctomycetota bacterium]|nr:phosphopantothenoylcysteine decarboxylase [Planctomycetota bacterium]MDI6788235.1 phosphopantothenoylcysteine decarboxylase [Planctomycetota bacterium]
MRILITAGPTYEYIDRIRYLSNGSSGKMGYALAGIAQQKGDKVILVSGPTSLTPPRGVKFIRVVSAHQMYRVVRRHYPGVDAVIMAAAVSDFTPSRYFTGKIKRAGREITLKLAPTVDILKELGRRKGKHCLIGFALEVSNGRKNALKKLYHKNLDYVVLNSPTAMGNDNSTVEIYNKNGLVRRMENTSKKQISRFIIDLLTRKRRSICCVQNVIRR